MFNLALSTNDLEKRWKIATTAKIKTCLHPHIQNYDCFHFINLNLLPEITSFSAAMHALNALSIQICKEITST